MFSSLPLFVVLSLAALFTSNDVVNAQFGQITQQLLANYDNTTRPLAGTNDPVEVQAALRVNRAYSVNPAQGSYIADFVLVLRWNDPRLVYTPPAVNPNGENIRADPNYFWTPDIFLYNGLAKQQPLDGSFIIAPNGNCQLSQHYIATLGVNFTLQNFPFDYQDLQIQVASFSRNLNTLNLTIITGSAGWYTPPNLTYTSALWPLSDYGVELGSLPNQFVTSPRAYIIWHLLVKRDPTTYIIKYMLPLFFVTFASTLTYWIDVTAVPARVAYGVSLLVSTVSLSFIVSGGLPKVNYITKMDAMVAFGFLFVFIALVEFAVVHHIRISGNVILSKSIENFFRSSSSISLIFLAIVVFYGFGDSSHPGVVYAFTALLLIWNILWIVITVFKHFRERKVAAEKKAAEDTAKAANGEAPAGPNSSTATLNNPVPGLVVPGSEFKASPYTAAPVVGQPSFNTQQQSTFTPYQPQQQQQQQYSPSQQYLPPVSSNSPRPTPSPNGYYNQYSQGGNHSPQNHGGQPTMSAQQAPPRSQSRAPPPGTFQ